MSSTTTTARASAPESPLPSGRQRADFARDCALDAFGRGAIYHLTSSNFVDREPDSAGDDEIVDGREAVARWLKLGVNLEDGWLRHARLRKPQSGTPMPLKIG